MNWACRQKRRKPWRSRFLGPPPCGGCRRTCPARRGQGGRSYSVRSRPGRDWRTARGLIILADVADQTHQFKAVRAAFNALQSLSGDQRVAELAKLRADQPDVAKEVEALLDAAQPTLDVTLEGVTEVADHLAHAAPEQK